MVVRVYSCSLESEADHEFGGEDTCQEIIPRLCWQVLNLKQHRLMVLFWRGKSSFPYKPYSTASRHFWFRARPSRSASVFTPPYNSQSHSARLFTTSCDYNIFNIIFILLPTFSSKVANSSRFSFISRTLVTLIISSPNPYPSSILISIPRHKHELARYESHISTDYYHRRPRLTIVTAYVDTT